MRNFHLTANMPSPQEAIKLFRLWDVETGKLIRTFRGHTDVIYSVAFSSDGKLALSGSWDATVRLWNVDTGETVRLFTGHSQGLKSSFDPGVYRVSLHMTIGTPCQWVMLP